MSTDSQVTNDMVYEGRVKWFNNKAGYGFITVIGGDKEGTDVFAHHSVIQVSKEQYRYLVEGEYLEFNISSIKSDSHKYQATDIRGVKGGKLLCETRNEARASAPRRVQKNGDNKDRPARQRGAGPRDDVSSTQSQSSLAPPHYIRLETYTPDDQTV